MYIIKEVNLHQQNNTCSVTLVCNASGLSDANISWSGYLKGDGASLNFTLSPANGSVTLNCTAIKDNVHSEDTVTVMCGNRTLNDSGEPSVPSFATGELLNTLINRYHE